MSLARTSVLALCAAFLVVIPASALSLAPACPAAQAHLLGVWERTGGASTRALAEAARDVVDACAVEEPAAGDAEAEARAAAATADRTIARECGIAGPKTGGAASAPIRGVVQLLFKTLVEEDEGYAAVAYEPTNDLMTYVGVGNGNWALAALNDMTGTITWHGVPFHATYLTGAVQAKTGCGVPPTPTLCWGTGYVHARIPAMGAITASGEFYEC